MADSTRNPEPPARSSLLRVIASMAGALTLTGAALPVMAAAPSQQDFIWSADVLSSDFRSDTLDLSGNVRVAQGDKSIQAGQAKARDVRAPRSRWLFEQAVEIRTSEAELFSTSASTQVVDGRIADARIEGNPARFQQRSTDASRQVSGRAGVIEYDFNSGIVKLSQQVWFSNGQDEFRGDVVIYNVRDERVQINPDGQSPGRVQGIIRPRQESQEATQPESGEDGE